jgi:hypothetical protein
MKRLDFEAVKQCFEDRSYKLFLKPEDYKGVKTKALYQCPKGHQGLMTVNKFRGGQGCLQCSGNVRKTIGEVKASFEAEGYTLLESEYINAFQRMSFVCNKGHHHSMSWDNFNHGKRCIYCSNRNSPLSTADVHQAFKEKGLNLLSSQYIPGVDLEYVCDAGHKGSISWACFNRRKGCSQCTKRSRLEYIKNFFGSIGYTLLSSEYKKHDSKLIVSCDRGHEYQTTWTSFSAGNRCYQCWNDRQRSSIAEVQAIFATANYQVLDSDYTSVYQQIKFCCDKGHEGSLKLSKFKEGIRCAECAVSGFKGTKPATLYYIRFDIKGKSYWKIGITNLTVEKRFDEEPLPFTVIQEKIYLFGYMAKEEEKTILNKYDEFKYSGPPLLKNGNTELFTKDVLKLDAKKTPNKALQSSAC